MSFIQFGAGKEVMDTQIIPMKGVGTKPLICYITINCIVTSSERFHS
jgi:hypothetical protein